MATKNLYSVKSTMYPQKRARTVDVPWKPTKAEALQAFADMLKKKGFVEDIVFRPFMVERTDDITAPFKDGKGNFYKEADVSDILPNVGMRLELLGLLVHHT